MSAQANLLAWSPRVSVAREHRERPSIEERFRAFSAEHPIVLERMLAIARRELHAGARRISAKAIWEELRASLSFESGAKFKLDNSLCSRFADACIEIEPQLDALIERRRRKAA